MKKYLMALVGCIMVAGCSSTQPPEQFTDLPLSETELLAPKWQNLQRITALYPVEHARAGHDGCATIEYVITPDYQVTTIKTIDADSRFFAEEATRAITRWNWSDLTPGKLTEPVKTRTRFEFCLESSEGRCVESQLQQERQCRGADVLFAVGHLRVRTR
ncbi:energy transducer TonB [Alkalimonas collagenimarina]|uniref:Energy transducer TonB n=1 Tax=Alkalimonas collagenimarina TaxID=400390 RepID=A0ABT9GZU6_9GAMM|nr:energy transducer TonB [Alkalimonas collagenimarina]MDP4536561.1 energy transducer TonB [Alkalimonas collagenimarina]